MNLDDRTSGLALIAGTVGVLATLGLHPSGEGIIDPAQYEAVTRHLIEVHSIALLSLPLWFLGAYGLSRRLACAGHATIVPLVFYGFALSAMMSGVVFDGLVAPGLARQIVNATANTSQGWKIAFHANGVVDMAFVHVFLVGSSLALILWSAAMVRSGIMPRTLGIYGLLLGLATIGTIATGYLDAHAHAFAMSILLQAVWLVAVGALMWRTTAAP